MLNIQVIKLSGVTGFLSHAWHRTTVHHRQIGANNPPSDVMMEPSQVRWAIPLSRAPLKVRRLHSPPLLSGPDCRSLKLYWVSAKALTLPISQHASSQLSLPSGGLDRALKGSTSRPRVRDTLAMRLLKSWPRSIQTLSLFLSPCDEIFSHQLKAGNLLSVWFCRAPPQLKAALFLYLFSGSTPRTPNHGRVASARCHLSNPLRLLRPQKEFGHMKVWWRGCGPATGLQVPPSRLEGVRQNRMTVWLIQ